MQILLLILLGQVDGGLSPPPPPPVVVPEGITFPRVIRTPGKVCIESLDDSGAVKIDCRLDVPDAPVKRAPPKELTSRLVADLALMGGGLLTDSGALIPEFAFTGDMGVGFQNGVGVVGLVHGHFTSLINRYGLGAGLRLGDKSHVTFAATLGLLVLNRGIGLTAFHATVLAQLSLVFLKIVNVTLMPSLSVTGAGAVGSVTAGFGLTL